MVTDGLGKDASRRVRVLWSRWIKVWLSKRSHLPLLSRFHPKVTGRAKQSPSFYPGKNALLFSSDRNWGFFEQELTEEIY